MPDGAMEPEDGCMEAFKGLGNRIQLSTYLNLRRGLWASSEPSLTSKPPVLKHPAYAL